MKLFDHNSGDYKMVDLDEFFEDVKRDAMNSGLELLRTYGIKGMKHEMGSTQTKIDIHKLFHPMVLSGGLVYVIYIKYVMGPNVGVENRLR